MPQSRCELIGERTRTALAYKRQQRQPTSHAPYGFRANGKRHCMDPIPRELVIVHRILEAWRAGGTYAGIAAQLNAEGVPTKRGGRWHASTVRGIVQRRAWYADILGGF